MFQVSERFAIPPARPTAYLVQRDGRYKTIAVADGTAKPQGPDRLPFGSPPQVDDALYLGFDEDISNLLLQVEIDGSTARGAGVDPEDAPLRWEMSQGGDRWADAEVLSDRTGGFNYGSGNVEVQCPADAGAVSLGGRSLRWLRCRLDAVTRSGATGRRLHAPAGDLLDHGRPDRRDGARRALRAGGRRVHRHQRRNPGAAVPAALLAGASR